MQTASQVSLEELRKVAHLACLAPNKDLEEQLRHDFSKLVHFVQAVTEVNTDGLEPMWTVLEQDHKLCMRADHSPDINSCRGSIADSSEVDTTGLEIMADVGADAGSMGVERTLSSATDASPPYFTAPKSVASSARK